MVTTIVLFELPDITPLDFDRIFDAASPIKNAHLNSDEQPAIFAHTLQSVLILTAGFSNICFVISV
jgi:hypothetical protein